MDSLNLSYAEGSVVLDQLVASQQTFGGSVEGNGAALAALAPALNAANLSVDEGIGLPNLFGAAGSEAAAPQDLPVVAPHQGVAVIGAVLQLHRPVQAAEGIQRHALDEDVVSDAPRLVHVNRSTRECGGAAVAPL